MTDIRELLILVLALLILFSLLRAVYVIHRRRKGQIRLSIDKNVIEEAELEAPEFPELPNGGARVVATAEAEEPASEQAAAEAEAENSLAGENVPILLDPVAVAPAVEADAEAEAEADSEPQIPERKPQGKRKKNWKEEILQTSGEGRGPSDFDMDLGAVSMTAGERIGGGPPKRSESAETVVPEPEPAPREQLLEQPPEPSLEQPLASSVEESPEPLSELAPENLLEQNTQPPATDEFTAGQAESKAEAETDEISADKIIAINVIAGEDREFNGRELWDFLHTAGLRLDKMKIFSKTEGDREDGKPIFRVANIVNPGIFDADAIDDFSTPGIGMFMLLPAPINNMLAFEQMLAVARRLAEALDGRLLDHQRRELTARGIEQARRRIREFDTGTTDSSSVGNGN